MERQGGKWSSKLSGILGIALASVLVLTFVLHTFETTHTHSPFEGAHEDVFAYLQYFHNASEELLFILLFALFSLVWGREAFLLSCPRCTLFLYERTYNSKRPYSYLAELFRRGILKNIVYS